MLAAFALAACGPEATAPTLGAQNSVSAIEEGQGRGSGASQADSGACLVEAENAFKAGKVSVDEFNARLAQCAASTTPSQPNDCVAGLDEKLKAGAMTEAQYKDLVTGCFGGTAPADPGAACVAGLDEKLKAGAITEAQYKDLVAQCASATGGGTK